MWNYCWKLSAIHCKCFLEFLWFSQITGFRLHSEWNKLNWTKTIFNQYWLARIAIRSYGRPSLTINFYLFFLKQYNFSYCFTICVTPIVLQQKPSKIWHSQEMTMTICGPIFDCGIHRRHITLCHATERQSQVETK